jgi:hypothetical protein
LEYAMKLQEVIAIARRKAQARQEAEAAHIAGREEEVREADRQAANFLASVICPFLKSVETELKAAGVPAMFNERYNDRCARCLLTIHADEDISPSNLAFEACRGEIIPKIKWTPGGRPTLLSEPDLVAVTRIVSEFITSALEWAPAGGVRQRKLTSAAR